MASSELVTLRGGLTLPLPALRLLWELEDRGFDLQAVEGGRLRVQPVEKLTADDVAAIKLFKAELLRVMDYCAREAWQ